MSHTPSQPASVVPPVAVPRRGSTPAQRRWVAALVLAASLAPLLVAAGLEPDPEGMGTHEQLGLPPCGFVTATGLPCATCGMTTSFAHAAHGQLLDAVRVQPAGAFLAVGSAMTAVVSAVALATGAALTPLASGLLNLRFFLVAAALVLASWAYKIVLVL